MTTVALGKSFDDELGRVESGVSRRVPPCVSTDPFTYAATLRGNIIYLSSHLLFHRGKVNHQKWRVGEAAFPRNEYAYFFFCFFLFQLSFGVSSVVLNVNRNLLARSF